MDNYISYEIALQIRGYDITNDEISSLMRIESTDFYDESNRPLFQGKDKNNCRTHNLWIYEESADALNYEQVCDHFFSAVKNIKNVRELGNRVSDMRFNLFVSSQLAQMQILLSNKFIDKLKEYDLPIDIDILSMGMVENKL